MAQEGSPPQVRGKRSLRAETTVLHEDHPRRCGENFVPSLAHCGQVGSPPQVRGKLLIFRFGGQPPRITPAGAGKTILTKTPKPKQKDHPRRCGENFDVFIITSKQIGSPPQVRGKLFVPADITTKSRITPAGAGKTPLPRPRSKGWRDHPRRCGENSPKIPIPDTA